MAAAKKSASAAKKTASASKPRTSRPSPNTAKWIRNLRNHPVHLRFKQEGADRPFFVELAPRGLNGDAEKIPAKLTQTRQFSEAVYNGLVEVITEREANEVQYAPVTYLGQQGVSHTLVRDEDTVVRRAESRDTAIQANPRSAVVSQPAGPNIVEMPGSLPALKPRGDGAAPTAEDMIPAGVDVESRKVTIERHRS